MAIHTLKILKKKQEFYFICYRQKIYCHFVVTYVAYLGGGVESKTHVMSPTFGGYYEATEH